MFLDLLVGNWRAKSNMHHNSHDASTSTRGGAGYLVNEELNGKVFQRDPSNPEEVIYNTGDLAKRDGDALFCLGRKDLQVKLRGFRIEVEEIASILKRHPLVGDCCVDLLYASPPPCLSEIHT